MRGTWFSAVRHKGDTGAGAGGGMPNYGAGRFMGGGGFPGQGEFPGQTPMGGFPPTSGLMPWDYQVPQVGAGAAPLMFPFTSPPAPTSAAPSARAAPVAPPVSRQGRHDAR